MTGAIDRQRGRLARLTGQAGRSAAPAPHPTHSPAKVEQCNGAAGPLTFALVLITATLAARPR